MDSSLLPHHAQQLEQLRRIAESETGMVLSGTKDVRFIEAVETALGQWQIADFSRILADPNQHNILIERLTSALTIGESFFFRNEHHFRALREQVIPQVLDHNQERREIRFWSAGCSTGEEPYSLAILLDQLLGQREQWSVSILATDINPQFLERARQAEYRSWSFRRTEIQLDRNWFIANGDTYQLVPRIRDHVRFVYLNLVKDLYPSPLMGLDLILFRNVAIYLRPEIIAAILSRFYQALRPGGWLLLGEAEVALAPQDRFKVVRFEGATFFQKPANNELPVNVDVASAAPILPTRKVRPQPTLLDAPPRPSAALRPLPKSMPAVEPYAAPLEKIKQCLQRDDLDEAENLIDKINNLDERVKTRLFYVRAILQSSYFTRASAMLDRCLVEEPLLIEAQLLKATLAEENNDLAEAEQAYRRALYIDRNCEIAHFQLAMLQQQRRDVDAARKSLQTVLNLAKSKDADALVEHSDGICYGRLREMARMMMEV